jgi:hypothetical protein
MQIVKRLLMGFASILAAALLLALAAPRSVHALVATLVQVANTTANPVVAEDADRASRISYQSQASFGGAYGCYSGFSPCLLQGFGAAPAGYRLVLQNIDALLQVANGDPVPFGFVNSAGAQSANFIGGYAGHNVAVINQHVTSYYNAGDSPSIIITANWYAESGAFVTLTGYLENCGVTGCPAVQH